MSLSPFSLQNKAALVIGASTPIGRATAIALTEAGAQVALTTIQPSEQEEAAVHACVRDLQALAGNGFAEVIDTTSEEDVTAVVHRTVAALGGLDILVNAPDLPYAKPLSDVTLREWHRVLEVNLTSVYLACRAASGPMLTQGKGRVINVISLLGERGMANGSAYCAAQAGVLNLTRALALEWARNGITVNAVGAGWTEGMKFIADDSLKQQLIRYLPHRRLAQPHEIGEAVVYLASDTAGFLTGQIMWIDGGVRSRL
jgi:NAD(P)-dependent dehydrogenase (short-subunit alcohol dehydrogenase family)